jgi:hypothetical protein
VILAATLAVVAALALVLFRGERLMAQASGPAAAKGTAGGPHDTGGLEFLKGRWQRPDGGYVIEIRAIDAAGKMEAGYFNPRPIRVSRAHAALEGTAVKVFLELRDTNYPGATYHLTYDPDRDQLRGVYFQPALQQRFDIFFHRMK